MAKVSLGPLISEARNSQGTTVFSANHAGPYTRARVAPSQTPTAGRDLVQAAMRALMLAWRSTLTQSQRDAWNALAARTPPKPAPVYPKKNGGLTWFLQANLALQMFFTPHFDPPLQFLAQDTGPLTGLSFNSDTPLFNVDVENEPDANHALMIYASDRLTMGATSNRLTYYAMAQIPGVTAGPYDIGPAYTARFPFDSARPRVFVKAHMLNLLTGATSQDYFAYVDDIPFTPPPGDSMITDTIDLTAAQLNALNSAPPTLVAAPGAGKLIHVLAIQIIEHLGTITRIFPGGDTYLIHTPSPANQIWQDGSPGAIFGGAFQWNWFEQLLYPNSLNANFDNLPVELASSVGDATTPGDSTARIVISYTIEPAI